MVSLSTALIINYQPNGISFINLKDDRFRLEIVRWVCQRLELWTHEVLVCLIVPRSIMGCSDMTRFKQFSLMYVWPYFKTVMSIAYRYLNFNYLKARSHDISYRGATMGNLALPNHPFVHVISFFVLTRSC